MGYSDAPREDANRTEPYNAKITHIGHFYPTLVKKSTYTLKSSLKKWTFVHTFVTSQIEKAFYDRGIFKSAVLNSGSTLTVWFRAFDSPFNKRIPLHADCRRANASAFAKGAIHRISPSSSSFHRDAGWRTMKGWSQDEHLRIFPCHQAGETGLDRLISRNETSTSPASLSHPRTCAACQWNLSGRVTVHAERQQEHRVCSAMFHDPSLTGKCLC